MKLSDSTVRMARISAWFHIFLYRLTGGAIGGKMMGCPALLLTTTGRKSGKQITKPIFYVQDGDTCVVAASFLGSDTDPLWWKNLQADPKATVEVGRRRFEATARKLEPADKDRLWPKFVAMYKGYDQYKTSTSRDIPLVALDAVGT